MAKDNEEVIKKTPAKTLKHIKVELNVASVARQINTASGACPDCGATGLCEHRLVYKPGHLPY